MAAPAPALPVPSAPTGPSRPPHRDGNALRWLLAYTASLVGDGVYFVALGWAAQKVADPAGVGFVRATGPCRARYSCWAAGCSPTASTRAGSSWAATRCGACWSSGSPVPSR
ncbi:hypothetical protein GA0115246_108596 [Streptomyces sp. SolWspMP-sol7th]|uniref:hypothetical protein n=1 Tax=Streptomyces sp. SolWspMP-sol7th TaxID=1839776 RepID=UPI00081EF877|nr:hypothetical protein GA0115246_108596 [Streptomyces sp. SolWspMP-sol7th]